MKSVVALIFAAFATASASVIVGQSVYHVPVLSRSPFVPPVYTSVYSAPVVAKSVHIPVKSAQSDETIISGPSGVIATKKASSQPGVITYHTPAVVQTPVVHTVHYSAPAVVEKKYLPPTTTVVETRKYLPPASTVVESRKYLPPATTVVESRKYLPPVQSTKRQQLLASPYGLVPAGSGLEGAYVPDISEKFYDDGSYRAEHH